jgi:superfamily II DNA or RNA helicase
MPVHFRKSNGPTGSGKTYRATTLACERASVGIKSAIIQPTIALCEQSYYDARQRFPPLRRRKIKKIVSDRNAMHEGSKTEYIGENAALPKNPICL